MRKTYEDLRKVRENVEPISFFTIEKLYDYALLSLRENLEEAVLLENGDWQGIECRILYVELILSLTFLSSDWDHCPFLLYTVLKKTPFIRMRCFNLKTTDFISLREDYIKRGVRYCLRSKARLSQCTVREALQKYLRK